MLRPTWHFVSPDDIRWLLELTGPRIRRLLAQQQKALGIGDDTIDRSEAVIADLLSGNNHMTRDSIGTHLRGFGLPGQGQELGLILMHAESSSLICSGAVEDGAQTYALVSERAPHARVLQGEDAVAELVVRYFTGHGPATELDLTYWASLTVADVRAGLAEVADKLDSFDHEGRTYWYGSPQPEPTRAGIPRGHLLQILDVYYRGYQDSRHVLDAAGIVPKGRETSTGMALVDGQMVGGMRRKIRGRRVTFEVLPFYPLDSDAKEALIEAGQRCGEFLQREAEVEFAR